MTIELKPQPSGVHAVEKLDTGLTCLTLAARSLGIPAEEEKIKQTAGHELYFDTKQIIKAAKELQLKAKVIRPPVAELPEQPIPSIAKMKNGNFVLVGRNNETKILIFDPYAGKPSTMAIEEFASDWTGELILIKKPFSLKDAGRYFNITWFIPVLLRYKRIFAEVFAASFFLQLFGLVTPLFTQVIIDKVLLHKGIATLDVLAVVLLTLAFFQSGMSMLRTYLFTHTTNKVDVILGTRLFRHIAALPLKYFETRRVGDTLMRVGAMNGIRDFLTGPATTAVLDTFFSIVFIAVMFYYSVPLTLLSLAVIPLFLLQNLIATPIYRERLNEIWAAGAENNAFLVEAVTGIHTVKSLALEPQFNHRWEQLLARYVRTTFDNSIFHNVLGNTSSLLQRLSSFSILWFGGHMVIEGKMTIGQLIAFQMLAAQANAPLLRLVGLWQSFQQAALSVERLGDILNTPPEPAQTGGRSPTAPVQGSIVFENVSFRYTPDGQEVLRGVNLHIPQGLRVGIVGRSGSGKSTLTKLVQRLYTPDSGRVLIDGADLAQGDPVWLRRQIGVVLQENYLFNGSVRDNISLTRPSIAMEEVIRAAVIAGAHEFILELPEGYDTQVGERGTALSGGQRQRIAIARALLTNPRIIIFDEATSALDYQSEDIIMKNLDQIGAGKTMLIIAHRLSTVRSCDLIFALDHGQVVEQGTHDSLMAARGLYYNLYMQQEV